MMISPMEPLSDPALRQLRDRLYPAQCKEQIQSDAAWEQVKPAWRRDEAWLREQGRKLDGQK